MNDIIKRKRQLLANNKKVPETYEELGWCCEMLGEFEESIKWYEHAAYSDDEYFSVEAQCALGNIYMHSNFSGANEQIAISWYRKAALKGHGCAQASLGHYYKEKKDFATAKLWS